MRKSTIPSVLSILASLAIAGVVAWAGSQGGQRLGSLPLFALCGGLCFVINWIVFVPSYAAKTERYYDLTGSVTYLSVVACAVALGNRDPRSLLLALLIGVWALRLGSFLFARIRRDGADRRFDALKRDFLRFLMTWTLQGLWVFLTAACALAAISAATLEPLGPLAALGTAIWIAGLAIEVIADRQKSRFREDPANRERFITTGLWAWSRHPNYLGEVMFWWGLALFGLAADPAWWWTCAGALSITAMFVFASIPMMEKRMLERRPAYARVQESTSALIPWRRRIPR